jgi:hypothetical protein
MASAPTAVQRAARDWYVSPGGNVWHATGAEADLLRVAGWQGPMTYAQAEQIAGTTPGPLRSVNQAATNVADQVGTNITGVADIGDFFHRLTEGSTWVRVGEVALGGILLFVGVRALAHGSGSPAVKSGTRPVKKVAAKAVKVAVPEVRLATRTAAKRVAPRATARVASHRARVTKYGGKTPYSAPQPRVSHIYHHRAGPKKVGP